MTAALEDYGAAEHAAVAVAAGGAAWEGVLMDQLADTRWGLVVLRRCLDVADLLALAVTGAVRLAVVAEQLPGLDVDALARLRGAGVRVVAVSLGGWDTPRLRELGVDAVLTSTDLAEGVGARLRTILDELEPAGAAPAAELPPVTADADAAPRPGCLIAVWGPHGAPGRTTVAVGLAAELARSGTGTLVLDADPYGGAVAQHLGVLEEVSGLLSAARLANSGDLAADRLATLARGVGERLTVLTGLPRPDRWTEVRPAALRALLAVARATSPVTVVDAGFGLGPDSDGGPGPYREDLSAVAVEEADHLVVVASADPVGLTRLARSLGELRAHRLKGPDVVVVNRMRRGLGWSKQEVTGLVEGFAPQATVCFLPEDRDAADRALVSGRTLTECGDSSLRRAVAGLTSDLVGRTGLQVDEAVRRSAAGRARRR